MGLPVAFVKPVIDQIISYAVVYGKQLIPWAMQIVPWFIQGVPRWFIYIKNLLTPYPRYSREEIFAYREAAPAPPIHNPNLYENSFRQEQAELKAKQQNNKAINNNLNNEFKYIIISKLFEPIDISNIDNTINFWSSIMRNKLNRIIAGHALSELSEIKSLYIKLKKIRNPL